jgi:AcrR family transcriptional regulator
MRARIVDAAVRVLTEEGALGFTTTKVADEAGISVGSLYQYFPNKHALVLTMHQDMVRAGWDHVQDILDAPLLPARQKVNDVASWFFATESAEASRLGAVFDDVEVFLRDRHDDDLLDSEVLDRFTRFVASASPRLDRQNDAEFAALASPRLDRVNDAEFAARLIMTTLEAVGKALASRPLSAIERDQWAVAMSTMLCDYLEIGDR